MVSARHAGPWNVIPGLPDSPRDTSYLDEDPELRLDRSLTANMLMGEASGLRRAANFLHEKACEAFGNNQDDRAKELRRLAYDLIEEARLARLKYEAYRAGGDAEVARVSKPTPLLKKAY